MSENESDTAPWDPDRAYFKLSLKGHSGYEAAMLNIGAGTIGEFRRAVASYFGWTDEEVAELSPAQLAFNATQQWHAMHNIGREMNGTRAVRGGGSARDRAYQAAKEESQPDPKEVLLAQIDAQEGVPALKRLYGENRAAFEEKDGDGKPTPAAEELTAAYKAKGKALSAK